MFTFTLVLSDRYPGYPWCVLCNGLPHLYFSNEPDAREMLNLLVTIAVNQPGE